MMITSRNSTEVGMSSWEASLGATLEEDRILMKRRFDEDGEETDEDFGFDDDEDEDDDLDDDEDLDGDEDDLDDDEDYDDFSFDDEEDEG
jgi:hypothetical protein